MDKKTITWIGNVEQNDASNAQKMEHEVQSPTAFQKLKDWSLDTCTNGVPNIARADNKFSRIFWILISLAGTAFTIEQSYEAFDKYLKHPINVNLKYKSAPYLEFPSITVCNLNPIRLSAIADYAAHHPELAASLGIGINSSSDTNKTHVSMCRNVAVLTSSSSFTVLLKRGADAHATRIAFLRLMADINDTHKFILGHQREKLIIHCTYEGEECLASDFHSFWSSHHGNCYTFNHGYENRSDVHLNSKSGSSYGLKLELNLEQHEYIDKLSEAAGARIVIHKANTMPFPDDMGTFASPGYLTSIAARLMRIDRLPYPFEDMCKNYTREEAHSHSIYSFMYDVNYTKDACLKTCLQAKIIEKCDCASSELPFNATYFSQIHVDKAHHGGDVLACTSESKVACMEDIEYKFKHGELNCDYCPVSCFDIYYPEKVSIAQWPSTNHKKSLYESLAAEGAHLDKLINGDNTTAASPSDNLLKVEIFFDQLNYEHIYQVEAFCWTDLLAALGGVVGLFLGISAVAIFEYFELGVILIAHCCTSRTKQKSSVSPVPR